MIIHRAQVKIPQGKRLLLIPLGDVQGEEELDRLDRLVQWCGKQEKAGHLVRLVLTGDYFETFSPSERARKAGANFHETTLESIHNTVKAQADDFVRRLTPMKGRIFTVLQGHHWENIKINGVIKSSDQYIAEKLGAEYAGDGLCVVDLLVNGHPFKIVAMHGYGSARTPGAKLAKRIRMREVILNAHAYFMGHDNQKASDVEEPLIIENGELKYHKQIFSGVGSFQNAYHLGKLDAGYVERLALAPASVGVVILTVTVEEQDGKKRLDYHLSV